MSKKDLLEIDHPRMVEFFVDKISSVEPQAVPMFLNIQTEIAFILRINDTFSLLQLKTGQKYVIYGNSRVQNTRLIYGFSRSLTNKHTDYFSDKIIRPSIYVHYFASNFEVEDVHLDNASVFGILFALLDKKQLKDFENNSDALKFTFGDKKFYNSQKNKVLADRANVLKELEALVDIEVSNFKNKNSQ